MSRAEQFLEGFKLGDLGAGKTKFVGPSVYVTDLELRSLNDLPMFRWDESDNWVYLLQLRRRGPSIVMELSGEDSARKSWLATYVPDTDAIRLFDQYTDAIKRVGIQRLIDDSDIQNFEVQENKAFFNKWLKFKKEEQR